MPHTRLAKTLSILIPVCAFTVLLPVFEHQIEAQTVVKPTAMVLGAATKNTEATVDTVDISNQQRVADFVVYQSKFEPLEVNAKSILVFDPRDRKVLIERNSDQRLEIASLTKLMTALVAMEDSNFNNPITITSSDHVSITPALGLRDGDRVMPIDLVKAMLVGSANDAAWTLANHFPNRKDFVVKMNAKAVELGMAATHYDNPVGFDSKQNYSTAQDLQKLVSHVLPILPYDDIWKQLNFSFVSVNGVSYHIKNSNDLVSKDLSIHSIKTGYTAGAMANMIVQAENPDGHKVIVMVLGTPNRDGNTKKTIDYVFNNFSWK